MHFEKAVITVIVILLVANLIFSVYSKYKIDRCLNKLDSFVSGGSRNISEVEVEDGLIHSIEDDGLPLRPIDMIDRHFDPTEQEMISPTIFHAKRSNRIEPAEQDSYH